ncbi:hypothetical protein AGLY_018014 [Aphis glycines]|uniref:Uncharacterized protein n=1 Tax=Aphis glycines TaxID=307491 RepID=A0A6G0SUE1_APHGL|nr:hypothetical protein AGLY_018014 [Aphis glycines]
MVLLLLVFLYSILKVLHRNSNSNSSRLEQYSDSTDSDDDELSSSSILPFSLAEVFSKPNSERSDQKAGILVPLKNAKMKYCTILYILDAYDPKYILYSRSNVSKHQNIGFFCIKFPAILIDFPYVWLIIIIKELKFWGIQVTNCTAKRYPFDFIQFQLLCQMSRRFHYIKIGKPNGIQHDAMTNYNTHHTHFEIRNYKGKKDCVNSEHIMPIIFSESTGESKY